MCGLLDGRCMAGVCFIPNLPIKVSIHTASRIDRLAVARVSRVRVTVRVS